MAKQKKDKWNTPDSRSKTEEAVYQALGEVSAPYWKKLRTTVFDSEEANRIGKNTMKVILNDTELAVKILTSKLKKDKGLRVSYKANIAMAFKDTYAQHKKKKGKPVTSAQEIHDVANEAAEYFLKLLCGQIKYPKGH